MPEANGRSKCSWFWKQVGHEKKPLTFYYTGCLIGILMKEVRWATDTEKFDFNSLVDQEFATSLKGNTRKRVPKKNIPDDTLESLSNFFTLNKNVSSIFWWSPFTISLPFHRFDFFPIVIRLSNKLFRCSKFLHLNWTNVHHGFCHASFKISLNQKGLRCVNRPLEPKWPLFWFEKALLWGSWTSKFGSRERYSAFLSTLFVCVWGMFQMIPLFRKKKTFDCKEIKKPPGWREPWNPVMVHYTLPETNIFALENRPNHKTKQSSSNHPLSGAKMWVFREGIWSTS